jgi:RND family efflux transporter MFP subunit
MPTQMVPVRRSFGGYGTARAMDTADVPARVTATVVELPEQVQDGARVEEGQLLVRLDDSEFLRQVEITTNLIADLDAQLQRLAVEKTSWERRVELVDESVRLARAEYDRVNLAVERNVAQPRELDVVRKTVIQAEREQVMAQEELDKLPARMASLTAQREQQRSNKDIASLDLDRCTIRSPIQGVIQSVDLEIGEGIVSGQRVARVVSRRRVEVPLRVAASARPELTIGDEAVLESVGSTNQQWQGSVSRIAPEDDERTRTLAVYIDFEQDPELPGSLAPGQFVRGTVYSRREHLRTVVPRRSLQSDRLMLATDGILRTVTVTVDFQVERALPELGLPDTHWVALRDPLEDGSLVVISPSRSLVDGMRVTPVLFGSSSVASMAHGELDE